MRGIETRDPANETAHGAWQAARRPIQVGARKADRCARRSPSSPSSPFSPRPPPVSPTRSRLQSDEPGTDWMMESVLNRARELDEEAALERERAQLELKLLRARVSAVGGADLDGASATLTRIPGADVRAFPDVVRDRLCLNHDAHIGCCASTPGHVGSGSRLLASWAPAGRRGGVRALGTSRD